MQCSPPFESRERWATRPYETRVVDVAALQAQGAIPLEAHWASVFISAPVHPDDLMAVAASYDKTGRYGTQTPFNDQLAAHWEGGKWQVDGTHDSIITAGDGGTGPTQAQLTLFYNNGKDKYQIEQALASGEQMWVDVGNLIRGQTPDKDGHTLPPDLAWGAYQLRDLTDRALGSLFEGKLVLDKTYGHAAYGCSECCGNYPGFMLYDPIGVPVGGSADQWVEGTNQCTGAEEDVTTFFHTWWTDNTSIATASLNQISGVAARSTNNRAQGNLLTAVNGEIGCNKIQDTPGGPVNVTPVISGIAPGQGLVGTAVGVTISGTGFASGATVDAGSNISVANVSVTNSTTITATFTPKNASSAGGNQLVTVTASGQKSNPANFVVQIPTGLGRIDEPGTPTNGAGPLTTGTSITVKDLGSLALSPPCSSLLLLHLRSPLRTQNRSCAPESSRRFPAAFTVAWSLLDFMFPFAMACGFPAKA